MNSRSRPGVAALAAIIATGGLLVAPAPAVAQDVVQSPVPKEACCLNNFRHAGTCRVVPRQGQLCQNILNYLNSINSSGETYCNATVIRGGWTLVDCGTGDAAAPVGTMEMRFLEPTGAPETLDVVTPSEANLSRPRGGRPGAVDPRALTVSPASVIQVRLERPVEGDQLDAGQQLSGRLESDLLGPDGEVIAPAGATVSATVGARQAWDLTRTGTASLQLVGTTTTAADLFGTANQSPGAASANAPAIQLTGDVVELSSDSVLTFELRELSDQPADLRVLTTATSVWIEAFNGRDPVTLAGLWSDGGAMLPPDGGAIVGRDAIYDYWKGLLGAATSRLELVNVETVVEGDLGYKAGRFLLVDESTGTTVDHGKYMQIWKRSPGGFWELHRDMWNGNGPVPAAARPE